MHITPVKNLKEKRGFTLIELLVSIVIFMMMTALLIAKYGNFNSSVLLTNAAYDVAIAIREAQTFGVSVKGQQGAGFNQPYGVHFSTIDDCNSSRLTFSVFSTNDSDISNGFTCGTVIPYTSYNFKKNIYVTDICAGLTCGKKTADIVFVRPIPDPKMFTDSTPTTNEVTIKLKSSDGTVRSVIVRENGQITIGN